MYKIIGTNTLSMILTGLESNSMKEASGFQFICWQFSIEISQFYQNLAIVFPIIIRCDVFGAGESRRLGSSWYHPSKFVNVKKFWSDNTYIIIQVTLRKCVKADEIELTHQLILARKLFSIFFPIIKKKHFENKTGTFWKNLPKQWVYFELNPLESYIFSVELDNEKKNKNLKLYFTKIHN